MSPSSGMRATARLSYPSPINTLPTQPHSKRQAPRVASHFMETTRGDAVHWAVGPTLFRPRKREYEEGRWSVLSHGGNKQTNIALSLPLSRGASTSPRVRAGEEHRDPTAQF